MKFILALWLGILSLSSSVPNNQTYTLIATGDVILARAVNAKMVRLNNFLYPFENTASFLQDADITLANFESPLVDNCSVTTEGMTFCGDPRGVSGLVYSGIDIVNLANNHMRNYGQEGVDNTIKVLEKNNINSVGYGRSSIIKVKDKKFGFLGYDEVGQVDDNYLTEIPELKKQADFVIVAFHWGSEYTSSPSAAQIKIAHKAIDVGADLIIGNHPHWVQYTEKYKDKFITYAHGNFIFDQMWSQETREGVIGKYTFDKNGLIDIKFTPIIIDDYSQPRFTTKEEGERILVRMKTL